MFLLLLSVPGLAFGQVFECQQLLAHHEQVSPWSPSAHHGPCVPGRIANEQLDHETAPRVFPWEDNVAACYLSSVLSAAVVPQVEARDLGSVFTAAFLL
jgi:hypothetical protein